MKQLLLSALLLAGLSGCGNKGGSNDPSPLSPTGPTWTMTSSTLVTTPANGGASTTQQKNIVAGSVVLSFTADSKVYLSQDARATGTGSSKTLSGTYVVSNGVITNSYPGAGAGGTTYVENSTVFGDHNLTLVNTDQTSSNKYVRTETYTR